MKSNSTTKGGIVNGYAFSESLFVKYIGWHLPCRPRESEPRNSPKSVGVLTIGLSFQHYQLFTSLGNPQLNNICSLTPKSHSTNERRHKNLTTKSLVTSDSIGEFLLKQEANLKLCLQTGLGLVCRKIWGKTAMKDNSLSQSRQHRSHCCTYPHVLHLESFRSLETLGTLGP